MMVGHVIISFAQPFVLAAPTRYSRLWFSDGGRTSATAVASLASALGAIIGGFVGPALAEASGTQSTSVVTNQADRCQGLSSLILYISIISSVACAPAPFLPSAPPSPPSALAASPRLNFWAALRELSHNRPFYLMFASFAVFLSAFQATGDLANEIVQPYGFNEVNAGIATALMVIAGIIAAAIASPILDRTKSHLLAVKIIVPLIALSYTVFIFIPQTKSVAALFTIFAIMGATSFAITPGTLEYQAEMGHPVSPEILRVMCWSGGQLLSAIFIMVMQSLTNAKPWAGQTPQSIFQGLVFQAVMVWAVVPLTLLTGVWIIKWPTAVVVELECIVKD